MRFIACRNKSFFKDTLWKRTNTADSQFWKVAAIEEDRKANHDSRILQEFVKDIEITVDKLTVKKSTTHKTSMMVSHSQQPHTVAAEPIATCITSQSKLILWANHGVETQRMTVGGRPNNRNQGRNPTFQGKSPNLTLRKKPMAIPSWVDTGLDKYKIRGITPP